MDHPVPIQGFSHVELFVGNALQAAYYYRNAFGFRQVAYSGPETGRRDRASYLLQRGDVRVVLTSPLGPEDPRNVFLTLHGDGVKDIALAVADVDGAFQSAVSRGARPSLEPLTLSDADGEVRVAAIRTYGDTIHTFVDRSRYRGVFLPGFRERVAEAPDMGFLRIDHVVGNVEDRQMDRWADWYVQTLGFHRYVSYDDKDISTEFTALRSQVMASEDRAIKMPINEPTSGRKKSQIQEYIDANVTAGVQHVALYTDDIIGTVSRMRQAGVDFLHVPGSYYDTVWDRVGDVDEDRAAIRRLGILVDRDEKGYLLQLFTKPVQDRPTLFFEVIQRRGCESFGKGNFQALFESIEREQFARGNG